MPDMLGTGLSSLRALQRALDTTAHNIANVSTPGYSRQRVEFDTRKPQIQGSNWIGNGVDVSQVRRIYDQFLTTQTRTSSGNLARLEAFATQAERLDNMLGDTTNGLSTSLQAYADALSEVSATPGSIPARQVLLSEGRALVQRMKDYDNRLRDMSAEIDTRFAGEAREVSLIAQGIARLNGEIETAVQNTGQAPNDLLDQRDRLIDEISSKVSVTTVSEGTFTNVFIGNGQPIVLGTTASEITTVTDPFDPERTQFALNTPTGTVDISRGVSGGTLGGLLDWRREMLEPARNELGRIALAITTQVNAQHGEGMNLTGTLGGDFFNIGGIGVTNVTTNNGTATVTATRTGTGAVTAADYVLANNGGVLSLRRQDTGAPVTFTGTGTALDPILADGMSIVVGAGSNSGDQYIIHPTRDAIRGFNMAITDPSRVAAAAPIRAAAVTGNTGTGTITSGEVLSVANPAALLTTANIVFSSPTQYTINGGPVQTYTAGDNIDFNGWRVQISGTPAAGDTFQVRSNAGATGDNRNALALGDAMRAGVLESGTISVASAVERLTADMGLQTRTAQVNRDAEKVVNADNLAARDAVSGVNLDEEAANMLRYQQAYQAAAQIIAVANDLFNSLISAVRR